MCNECVCVCVFIEKNVQENCTSKKTENVAGKENRRKSQHKMPDTARHYYPSTPSENEKIVNIST